MNRRKFLAATAILPLTGLVKEAPIPLTISGTQVESFKLLSFHDGASEVGYFDIKGNFFSNNPAGLALFSKRYGAPSEYLERFQANPNAPLYLEKELNEQETT